MPTIDKVDTALARLRQAAELSEFYYQRPLTLAYSGGKDSEVCLELAKKAGVPFRVIHNLTTADAPETVRHVRKKFHPLELAGVACEIVRPRYKGQPVSMWSLIPQKLMPPTRMARYCCEILKEGSTPHQLVIIGVRSGESVKRQSAGVAETVCKKQNRKIFDFDNEDERIIAPCQMKAEIRIHPIVDWTNADVWSFLRDSKTLVNPVYSMGCHRCGCVGCPLAGKARYHEFRVWPAYEHLYRSAFARMLEARRAAGKEDSRHWRTADELFRWWMEDENLEGQLDLFGGEVGKVDS